MTPINGAGTLSEVLTRGNSGALKGITNLGKMDSGQLTNSLGGTWHVSSPTTGIIDPYVSNLVTNPTANGKYSNTGSTSSWEGKTYSIYRRGATPWHLIRVGYYWLITDNIVSPEWATAIGYGAGGLPTPVGYYLKSGTETSTTITVAMSSTDTTIDSIVSDGSIYCDSVVKVKNGVNIGSKSLLVFDNQVGSEAFRISMNGGNTEFAYYPENGVAA